MGSRRNDHGKTDNQNTPGRFCDLRAGTCCNWGGIPFWTVFSQTDYRLVLQFWPLILIFLGVEVLLGCRQKNYEILDKEGKVLEQNKIVYDVPAILLTMALVLFSFIMALVNLALITSRHIVIR